MVSRRFPQRMKRLLPLVVAAALLLVSGPASAAGLDRDGGFWSRLSGPGALLSQVWDTLLDLLPMGGGSIDPNGGGNTDSGGSIDPHGGTSGLTGEGEGGGSIDPNGRV